MDDIITVTIDSLGARGDGIGQLPDGRRVFVLGTLPGESVAVTVGEARNDGVMGRLDHIVAHAPERVAPACIHFGICGGCSLQHINDDGYRAFKVSQVRQALERAGITAGDIDGPYISPPHSRRRATMAAYRGEDRLVVGFNEPHSNKIVDQMECPILKPRLAALVPPLRTMLMGILQPGQGLDVTMVESGGAVDMVLRPWVSKKNAGEVLPRHIAERLTAFAEQADLARLHWQNNAEDEADLTMVATRYPFTVDFSGVIVTPPPGVFLQATEDGETRLAQTVLQALPKRAKKIVDLYAGCGTFTFAMASAKFKVHAVEGSAPALNALKAAMHSRPVTAEKRDLAREPLLWKELNAFDAVVLDPPRVGALEQARQIAKSSVKTVVYVSCSATSFARDAEVLRQGGLVLKKLTLVDQFLWSPHIEMVGVFTR